MISQKKMNNAQEEMNTTIVPFFLYIWPLSVAYMLHASRHLHLQVSLLLSSVVQCCHRYWHQLCWLDWLLLAQYFHQSQLQDTNKVLIAYHGDTTYLVEVNYHVSLHQDPHFKETFHLMCLGRGEREKGRHIYLFYSPTELLSVC